MTTNAKEVIRREKLALSAIRSALGTDEDELGATLFVSHHLEEIEANYWKTHLGTDKPEPARVLDILVLRSHWGDEDGDEDGDEGDKGIDVFDFTLPGDVTDYVISVRFDEEGAVDEISMES
jgi:hypothetical protein